MPERRSAGIVLVRLVDGRPEVLLVHPGGPFWAKKDLGAWSIPKGEIDDGQDPLEVARREFREELGTDCPDAGLIPIGDVVQKAGKRVTAWCGLGEIDTAAVVSNTFELVWPPRSGVVRAFPEVDRAEYFPLDLAATKILATQQPLLDLAVAALVGSGKLPPQP
ncbi:MAG: hydrolase [Acidimicrobiales bacterium]|nr:hydrolase [Acidimicrobiales bacterium]